MVHCVMGKCEMRTDTKPGWIKVSGTHYGPVVKDLQKLHFKFFYFSVRCLDDSVQLESHCMSRNVSQEPCLCTFS